MSKRSVGPSTVKRNIVRESHPYFVCHQTHLFIRELSKEDRRSMGSYLDVLIEQVARQSLPPEKVEAIIAEGKRIEAERLKQAEEKLAELRRRKQPRPPTSQD